MIAALLCGLMYGALAYRAWWIKPRELKAEFEAWDSLSGEELLNFERCCPLYNSGTILVGGPQDNGTIFGHTEVFGPEEDPAHYGKGWGSGDHSGDYNESGGCEGNRP